MTSNYGAVNDPNTKAHHTSMARHTYASRQSDEQVPHKLPTKGPKSQPEANMGDKFKEGIFLGYRRDANTYIVDHSERGIVTTQALQKLPAQRQWNPDAMEKVNHAPHDEHQRRPTEVEFSRRARSRGYTTSTDATATPNPAP